MGRKRINQELRARPEVENALIGFSPKFGNDLDIDIVHTHGEIKHLLTLAESDAKRREEMKLITKTNNARSKEIKKKEDRLLWLLEKHKKLST